MPNPPANRPTWPRRRQKVLWIVVGALWALGLVGPARGQVTAPRLWDRNSIAWLQTFGRLQISDRWSLHAEYQLRRASFVTDPMEHVFRSGVAFDLHPKVLVRGGYVFTRTFPYGDYPLQEAGLPYSEHRVYQLIQFTDTVLKLQISHRFMTEQRFVGEYNDALTRQTNWPPTNRVRYMLRFDHALPWPARRFGRFYVAASDEVMVSFGPNVGFNVFDQNRFYAVIGGTPFEGLQLEGGLFMQTQQTSRLVAGRIVWQQNIGPELAAWWTLDMRRKKKEAK